MKSRTGRPTFRTAEQRCVQTLEEYGRDKKNEIEFDAEVYLWHRLSRLSDAVAESVRNPVSKH